MTAPLRHLTARILRRLGACIGAVLVLALLGGFAQAHHHVAPHDAAGALAGDTTTAAVAGASDCPHAAQHPHQDAECCLGPACVPALVPGASTPAGAGDRATAWCLAASAIVSGASEGQFRPPRHLLTA